METISILCFRRRPQQVSLHPMHYDVKCIGCNRWKYFQSCQLMTFSNSSWQGYATIEWHFLKTCNELSSIKTVANSAEGGGGAWYLTRQTAKITDWLARTHKEIQTPWEKFAGYTSTTLGSPLEKLHRFAITIKIIYERKCNSSQKGWKVTDNIKREFWNYLQIWRVRIPLLNASSICFVSFYYTLRLVAL